jgi:tetratricopeptide (TPR) repeat protein
MSSVMKEPDLWWVYTDLDEPIVADNEINVRVFARARTEEKRRSLWHIQSRIDAFPDQMLQALVIFALDDPAPQIRSEACYLVNRWIAVDKQKAARFEPLIRRLSQDDGDSRVREQAAEVVRKLAIVIDNTIDLILFATASADRKWQALQYIARNADDFDIETLQAVVSLALQDPETAVREAASQLKEKLRATQNEFTWASSPEHVLRQEKLQTLYEEALRYSEIYADLGQAERAIEFYQKVLTDSIEFYQKALSDSREKGDRSGESRSLGNLGQTYADLGQTERAIEYYQQALTISREIGDDHAEANFLSKLGEAYHSLGQTNRAIGCHKSALTISQKTRFGDGERKNLHRLALLYQKIGKIAEAIGYYQQLVELLQGSQELSETAKTLTLMGNLARDIEQFDQARRFWQEGRDIYLQISSPLVSGVEALLNELELTWGVSFSLGAAAQRFFESAGFGVDQVDDNELLLDPRERHLLNRVGSSVHASLELGRTLRRKDITIIEKRIRKRIGDDVSGHVAFLIVDQPLDYGARLQLSAYRFSEDLTLVPFDANQVHQAVQLGNCYEVLDESLGEYLGETDLYEAHDSAVSDVLSFFGRQRVISDLQTKLKGGDHVGIFGVRKMGKTSLMNRLQSLLPYPMAVISLQYVNELPGICQSAIEEWTRAISTKYPKAPLPSLRLLNDRPVNNNKQAFRDDILSLVGLLREHSIPPWLVLCLDEIEEIVPNDDSSTEEIKRYRELMGFFRGLASQINAFRLMVCGMNPAVNRTNYWKKRYKNPIFQALGEFLPFPLRAGRGAVYNNPGFQAFREFFLGPFETQDEMNDMVRSIGAHMGIEYDQNALDCLHVESGGHPYITRQICSLAIAQLPNDRSIELRREKILQAVEEYLRNPRTASYVEQELWGTIRDSFEHQILLSLAKEQPQTGAALIPQHLPPEQRNGLEKAVRSLAERWIIVKGPEGYTIPYGCLRRWISANYP